MFGFSTTSQSLPIGSCRLYLRDPILPLFATTNAAGFAATPAIQVPLDLTLRGTTLYAQAFVADPQGPVAGITFSQGLRLVSGD